MPEDPFVDIALQALRRAARSPLRVERGAALLYQVTINNRLEVTIDPKNPRRGASAFQTDICVFEEVENVSVPRVVMEFKGCMTTHDVLTYSAKARKHKQVYPYLRYGLVISRTASVPSRFFRHNEGLDFCLALGDLGTRSVNQALRNVVTDEVAASRRLESISFGGASARSFRSEVLLESIRRGV